MASRLHESLSCGRRHSRNMGLPYTTQLHVGIIMKGIIKHPDVTMRETIASYHILKQNQSKSTSDFVPPVKDDPKDEAVDSSSCWYECDYSAACEPGGANSTYELLSSLCVIQNRNLFGLSIPIETWSLLSFESNPHS